MRFYLVQGCPFAHRASIALQEKQLAFEPVFFRPDHRPPELAAISPQAKSPTLVDGEARIWDSHIVLEYLEDRYPTPALLPPGAVERATVRMLCGLVGQELISKLGLVAGEVVHKPEGQRDPAKIAEGTRGFLAALEAWDQRLAGREFLVGDRLTLADVTLYTAFPAIRNLVQVEVPAERAQLRAWVDRLDARPTTALLAPPA